MPSNITIKHANHKILPVTQEKKLSLLQLLLEENQDKSIAIFSSDIELLKQTNLLHPNLTLLSDTTDDRYEIVISYEIPQDAQIYLARVAQANVNAFLILLESEQNALYPIEVILGRAIKQEIKDGFGYPLPEPKEEKVFKKQDFSRDKKPYDKEKKPHDKDKKPFVKSNKPYDKDKKPYSGEKKPYDKDKKPYSGEKKPYDASKKKTNNFLGYDANGKAIFSGKSGDRNHKYDGTPKVAEDKTTKKTGKTFLIKELKKKDDDK